MPVNKRGKKRRVPPEHIIPPEILKPAAEAVYDTVTYAYDYFTPYDNERVRTLCGKGYESIPASDIDPQVINLRKRKEGDPLRLRQDKRLQKKVRRWHTSALKDCERRILEPDWPALSLRCLERDHYDCRNCPAKATVPHHRSYKRMRTPQEIDDLTSLCEFCHACVTVRLRHPSEMDMFVAEMLASDEEDKNANGQ